MPRERILGYVAAAIEFTKMLAVITTNTAIKLAEEGKKEMLRQYTEYNQKAGPGHAETLKRLTTATQKATSTVKSVDRQYKITDTGKKLGKAIDQKLDKSTSSIANKIKGRK